MNSIFPLFYSIALFLFLFFISFYIVKQIINTQKLEKKIFKLQKLSKKDDLCHEDCYQLGQLYLKKKLFFKAILIFRKALKLWEPNDKIGLGNIYNAIGFTFFNLEQYYYSIYYYKITIQIIPDHTLALINLGYAFEKINSIVPGYNCYKTVLFWDPNNELASTRFLAIAKKLRYIL
uniref:Uncharacterized protein n=1 Tax=Pleurocladia lacustris TaxID=246121 RepID=A0A1I9LVU9_9PHAE|nr:hypothetical protein [Pleurocladia lacustris]ANS57575.1 hypothetical protein [Pleurocladia lacustris]ANS57719.1 hypothetical protein [Pleurocladia lacustris]